MSPNRPRTDTAGDGATGAHEALRSAWSGQHEASRIGSWLGAAAWPGTTMEDDRMLVLTRKHGETVRIGKDIEVRVVRVKGNTIQLGITAPREVAVVRGELADKHERKAG